MVDKSTMVLVALLALTGGVFASPIAHAEDAMDRIHPYKGMWIPGSGEVTLPQWMEPGSGLLIVPHGGMPLGLVGNHLIGSGSFERRLLRRDERQLAIE